MTAMKSYHSNELYEITLTAFLSTEWVWYLDTIWRNKQSKLVGIVWLNNVPFLVLFVNDVFFL